MSLPPFAGPLAHAGENGAALVLLGDVPDQLLDDDRLAGSGASEEADLGALDEGADEVDDLDPRLQDLDRRLLVVDGRRRSVDRPALGAGRSRLVIDRLSDHVEHPAQRLDADRHHDRRARRGDLVTPPEAVGGVHRDAADRVVPDLLLDLHDHLPAVAGMDDHRVQDVGQLAGRELDVDDGADHLADHPVGARRGCRPVLDLCHSFSLAP